MTTFLYPYKDGSASAKALATALGIKRIKREGSKFKWYDDRTIINWGCSEIPSHNSLCGIINEPQLVALVTDKLSFFRQFLETNDWTVPYTTDQNVVGEWLANGKTVVARTILTGHSGAGITLLNGEHAYIPDAPLYTLYIPKKDEYRVHVSTNGVFDIQQKKRKTDVADEDVDWKIRNLAGGFVYAREGLTVPDCVRDVAVEVFNQTGLDFGAVDIIYNEQQNKAYALEINTAPGLTGTTLEKYTEMLRELI